MLLYGCWSFHCFHCLASNDGTSTSTTLPLIVYREWDPPSNISISCSASFMRRKRTCRIAAANTLKTHTHTCSHKTIMTMPFCPVSPWRGWHRFCNCHCVFVCLEMGCTNQQNPRWQIISQAEFVCPSDSVTITISIGASFIQIGL